MVLRPWSYWWSWCRVSSCYGSFFGSLALVLCLRFRVSSKSAVCRRSSHCSQQFTELWQRKSHLSKFLNALELVPAESHWTPHRVFECFCPVEVLKQHEILKLSIFFSFQFTFETPRGVLFSHGLDLWPISWPRQSFPCRNVPAVPPTPLIASEKRIQWYAMCWFLRCEDSTQIDLHCDGVARSWENG